MTENNLHHKIKMNKKVILVIVTFSIIATPALALASTPPWWVTATGGVIGGTVGAIAGGPIGAIAGATGGAIIADYIYGLTQSQSKSPSTLSTSQITQYLSSVTNTSYDSILESNSTALTENGLLKTSYYYFAQSMETLVPNALSNSTLNETYMGYGSGIYAAMDNISSSVIDPLNQISYNYFMWTVANSYPTSTATTFADLAAMTIGNNMSTGDYFFLTPYSHIFVQGNFTLKLLNIFNGKYVNISQTVSSTEGYFQEYDTSNIAYTMAIPNPTIFLASTLGITQSSVYEVISSSITLTGYPHTVSSVQSNAEPSVNQYSTFPVITTDAIQLSPSGAISNNYKVTQPTVFTDYSTYNAAYLAVTIPNDADYCFAVTDSGIVYVNGYTSVISLNNPFSASMGLLSGINSQYSGAYQSALAFFNELHNFGYFSASQVPASLLQTFPSSYVPASMLNGTFNATELQSLYVAYLLQLKSWLNETSTHTLKANMTVTNSTFNNGFVQVYGNLENNITSSGKISHYYYNNTWFVPLINLDKWTFKVHSWTNITNNTPDPNFLIVSGSDSGTLVNVVNGTFYTDAISVNGSSTSSFTISPVTIQYVLPHTVSIGKLNNGGFLFSKTAGLQNWELILAGIITVIGIAIVFDRKD